MANEKSAPSYEVSDDLEYSILDSPELRAQYISLTDEVIRNMVENHIDTTIFIDKSARPVAWLVDQLWDQLVPPSDEHGEPYKKPAFKFLNIDREQWGAIVGRSEADGIDINSLPKERIDELHALFEPVEGVEEGRPLLENKRILIVDEVSVSGDTLDIAERIISKAFPEAASVQGMHWMHGHVKTDPRSGVKTNTQLPVWYSDRRTTGRLVANRDSTKSSQSPSERQRVGRYWLSATFREPDTLGLQLKKEIVQLTEDLRRHQIPYMPSTLWGEEGPETIDDRIVRINGGIAVEDYIQLRRENLSVEQFIGAFAVRRLTSK